VLTFAHRARVQKTDIYVRRIWVSACGSFRVSEFIRRLEGGQRVYKAEWCLPGGNVWDVISTHRTRCAAERACRKRQEGGHDGNP